MSAAVRAACVVLLGLLWASVSPSSSCRFRIPPHDQVARVARFIAHRCDWASMATISTHKPVVGQPFSNVFSVSDGPQGSSSGVPYMYLTRMEISVKDLEVGDLLFTLLFVVINMIIKYHRLTVHLKKLPLISVILQEYGESVVFKTTLTNRRIYRGCRYLSFVSFGIAIMLIHLLIVSLQYSKIPLKKAVKFKLKYLLWKFYDIPTRCWSRSAAFKTRLKSHRILWSPMVLLLHCHRCFQSFYSVQNHTGNMKHFTKNCKGPIGFLLPCDISVMCYGVDSIKKLNWHLWSLPLIFSHCWLNLFIQ